MSTAETESLSSYSTEDELDPIDEDEYDHHKHCWHCREIRRAAEKKQLEAALLSRTSRFFQIHMFVFFKFYTHVFFAATPGTHLPARVETMNNGFYE
jgi:hypothetical protein